MVWVDSTNHVTIWDISNAKVTNTVALNGLDGQEWRLQGVGNFLGDTNSDLLWISNSGAVNYWEVNGSQVTSFIVNAPTGNSLQLDSGTQAQSLTHIAALLNQFSAAFGASSGAGPLVVPPSQVARGETQTLTGPQH
jgi:hypothetical protein